MDWDVWLLSNEPLIRLSMFFAVFAAMAMLEIAAPRRVPALTRAARWPANIGIVIFDSIIVRLLFPVAATGVAVLAAQNDWGLFNRWVVPLPVAVIVSVVVLDFAIYLQHVMFHAVPVLWRLHRVHHADLDFDVTTGARFHPVEIILSMLIKFAVIVLLGPPAVAVLVFEVILNGMAMFNHSNVRLPDGLDRIVRLFVVTPDMHRVHHSIEHDEANSNFGFNLSCWDRLCGTWREQPRAGHGQMVIGIDQYRDPQQVDRLAGMLALPFIGKVSGYAINRREWHNNDRR